MSQDSCCFDKNLVDGQKIFEFIQTDEKACKHVAEETTNESADTQEREEGLELLLHAKRNNDDTIMDYAYYIIRLVKVAYKNFSLDMQTTLARDYYVKGLCDKTKTALRLMLDITTASFHDLVESTICLEMSGIIKCDEINSIESGKTESVKKKSATPKRCVRFTVPAKDRGSKKEAKGTVISKKEAKDTLISKKEAKDTIISKEEERALFKAYYPGDDVTEPKRQYSRSKCSPTLTKGKKETRAINDQTTSNRASSNKNPPIILKIRINGNKAYAMLDTGATCCVIHMKTIQKYHLESSIEKLDDSIVGCQDASGNEMRIVGKIKLNTTLMGIPGHLLHEFRVLNTEQQNTMILGRDFLRLYDKITFDFKNSSVKIGNLWLKSVEIDRNQKVVMVEDRMLLPNSELEVIVSCNKSNTFVRGEFLPKLDNQSGLYASHAKVIPDSEGYFMIKVLNINSTEIVLKQTQRVGIFRKCAR